VSVTNSKPSVSISSPSNGSTFSSTDRIALRGSASDFDDGDLSAAIAWSSDRDGALGRGASITTTLTPGTHLITAAATDSGGAAAASSVTIQVTGPNAPPVVSLTAPQDGARIPSGTRASFSGTASDPQQGDLTSSLVWTSSIDGRIGTGGAFTKRLSNGTHTIRAKVVDAGGLAGKASVTVTVGNVPPTVSISDPPDGASVVVGSPVTFRGSATDVEDGDLTSTLQWTSSLDGALGSGGNVAATLSVGTHTITASVTDSRGATATATETITVNRSNTPPTIRITAPADGSSFARGTLVTASASASDAGTGGGAKSGVATVTFQVDGVSIGSDSTSPYGVTWRTSTWSLGQHTLTAVATDKAGNSTTSASITVTIR
jgi:hypothetical protein